MYFMITRDCMCMSTHFMHPCLCVFMCVEYVCEKQMRDQKDDRDLVARGIMPCHHPGALLGELRKQPTSRCFNHTAFKPESLRNPHPNTHHRQRDTVRRLNQGSH